MRPGGLLVAVLLLAACKDRPADPKTDPPPVANATSDASVPVAPAGDPVLAKALAERTAPAFAMPAHKTSPIGTCGVQIERRPAAESEPLLVEFRARNPGWTDLEYVPSVHEWNGFLTHQMRKVPDDAPAVTLDAPGAIAVAAEFLARNHELFGLDAGDVRASNVTDTQNDPTSLAVWEVEIEGERPRPGFERFADVKRQWRVSIGIGDDGKANFLTAQSMSLPDFTMCTDATISADDAKKAIIGYEPTFSDISGEPQKAGKVTAGDIKSVEPAIDYDGGPNDSRILRRAYRIEMQDGMWTYLVDAETGKILDVIQNFDT
jgi:hypothetical protein